MMNVWVVGHNFTLTSPLMSLGNKVLRSFSRVLIADSVSLVITTTRLLCQHYLDAVLKGLQIVFDH
jgi:hypothetical protein